MSAVGKHEDIDVCAQHEGRGYYAIYCTPTETVSLRGKSVHSQPTVLLRQNHRTVRLGRDLKVHLVPTPCLGQRLK